MPALRYLLRCVSQTLVCVGSVRVSLKKGKLVTPIQVNLALRRLAIRAIPPCPMCPATMLSTTEDATVADDKEAGVSFVFPRLPPSFLSSARGARRSVQSPTSCGCRCSDLCWRGTR